MYSKGNQPTGQISEQPRPVPPAHNRWLALTGVGLGVLMSTIDFSIVNIVLPTLVKEFNTDLATVQWVILSYALVVTSLMMGVARLGDLFGRKRIYVVGLWIFSLGSLLCGKSPTVGWLIGFRAFQGLGAVMMQALGAAIVTEIFPSSERGKALGIIGGIVSFGLAVGPALGGVLIGWAGWESIFLINIPIGLIALVVVAFAVPPSKRVQRGERFDLGGAFILLVTLACYSLGMTLGQRSGFGNADVLTPLSFSVAGFLVFLLVEWRLKQPMIDPRMFGNILLSLNVLMGLMVFITLAGIVVLPFFLENVQGYSTQTTGFLMMTIPLSMGLVAPWAGALSDRYGPRGISLIGLCIMFSGSLTISTLSESVGILGYILRIAPFGIGLGFFQSPNNSAVMGAVSGERLGVASGLLSLSRNLGMASGVPLLSSLFTTQLMAASPLPKAQVDVATALPGALVAGIELTYRVAAGIILLTAMVAAVAYFIDRRKSERTSVVYR